MSVACPSIIDSLSPSLCVAVDHYCERTSAAFDAEPVNALTNLAFLVGALLAWRLAGKQERREHRRLIGGLIITMAVVGLGSMLFHTVGTRWAEWGDVIPILVFMLLYLWLVLTACFGWAAWLKTIALVVFFLVTFYLEAAVPGTVLWGGALYLPTVLVLVVIGAVLRFRKSSAAGAMFASTGVFLASFAARTLDTPLCSSFPLGTHFLWHLLNALVLYLLVRTAIKEWSGRGRAETESTPAP